MKVEIVAYYRYSSNAQDTGFSVEAQRRGCHEFADKNNYIIVKEYIDRAFTGTNDARPEFLEMIEDSKRKEWTICLVHKMDRFSRDLYQSLYYTEKLKNNGVRVVSVSENFDLNTAEGTLLRNMMSSISDYFSKNLSKEVLKGMRENSHNCNFNGGIPSLGYVIDPLTKKYIINLEEAPIVKKIFELFNKSYLYKDIIAELDRLGYKNRDGKSFNSSTIRSMLKRELYTGVYIWGMTTQVGYKKKNSARKQEKSKVIRIEGGVPAIISKEEFEKAQIRINGRSRGEIPKRNTSNLLSGLIRCSCGSKMYLNTRKIPNSQNEEGKFKYASAYRCKHRYNNCKTPEIKEEIIENFIIDELFKTLSDEKGINNYLKLLNEKVQENLKGTKNSVDSLKLKIASLEKEISSLVKVLAKGVAEEEILKEIEARRREKNEIILKLEKLLESSNVDTISVEDFKEMLNKAKNFILNNKSRTPELKTSINIFVKSITISKEEIVVIYNLFLFYGISIPELIIKIVTTKSDIYKKYKKKKKFT